MKKHWVVCSTLSATPSMGFLLWIRKINFLFTELLPPFEELEPSTEMLETGIKVVDLLAPYSKGGKIGLFGGAGSVKPF